jgi:hypothetical protein
MAAGPLQVRIGIATGRVVLGDLIGAAAHTLALFLLAPSSGQRLLSEHRATRAPSGVRPPGHWRQRLAKLEAVLAQGTNDLSEVVPLEKTTDLYASFQVWCKRSGEDPGSRKRSLTP